MGSRAPLRLHTLPLDILIDLLKSLPSFSYLLPLILTHRAFNEVWKVNFNEISQAIAHNEFEPWENGISLMLEKLQLNDSVIATSKTVMHLKLPRGELMRKHVNTLYLGIFESYRDRVKKLWRASPTLGLKTERLHFGRTTSTTYRTWLFMCTMELPRCELMCSLFSIIELTEAHPTSGCYVPQPNWQGLQDFQTVAEGVGLVGLKGVMRPRISDYVRYDPIYQSIAANGFGNASFNSYSSGLKEKIFYAQNLKKIEERVWKKKSEEIKQGSSPRPLSLKRWLSSSKY